MASKPKPGVERRKGGPWIVVEVPATDDDPLYPSSRRFYLDVPPGSTEHVDKAKQFADPKEAASVANKLMHYSRNTWAEVVPFSMAWALVHAGGAPWDYRRPRGEP